MIIIADELIWTLRAIFHGEEGLRVVSSVLRRDIDKAEAANEIVAIDDRRIQIPAEKPPWPDAAAVWQARSQHDARAHYLYPEQSRKR